MIIRRNQYRMKMKKETKKKKRKKKIVKIIHKMTKRSGSSMLLDRYINKHIENHNI
jgi:hypothetical protein